MRCLIYIILYGKQFLHTSLCVPKRPCNGSVSWRVSALPTPDTPSKAHICILYTRHAMARIQMCIISIKNYYPRRLKVEWNVEYVNFTHRIRSFHIFVFVSNYRSRAIYTLRNNHISRRTATHDNLAYTSMCDCFKTHPYI